MRSKFLVQPYDNTEKDCFNWIQTLSVYTVPLSLETNATAHINLPTIQQTLKMLFRNV